MKKVNFDNLKNLNTPQSFIDNALNIPNQAQKPFIIKYSRSLAAVACLVIVCAVSLTVFFTQERITPPMDPYYQETAINTEEKSTQTDSTNKNESTTQNNSESKSNESESSTQATTPATQSASTNHNSSETVAPTHSDSSKPDSIKPQSPTKDSAFSDETPTSAPVTEPTMPPVIKPTSNSSAKPTVAPATEPTEPPIVIPTQRPTTAPIKLSLPTIPPPNSVQTEPTEPVVGVPATEVPTVPQTEVEPMGLYIKADGLIYEVNPSAVYQYTFYLTVPSAKIGVFNASTFYDTSGLEVMVPINDYGYDDAETIFPVFRNAITFNFRSVPGELLYNYSSTSGVRFESNKNVAMTIYFRVTADSGIYEINTVIKDLIDTNMNEFIRASEIKNESFTVNFALSATTNAPEFDTTNPTEPSHGVIATEPTEPEYSPTVTPTMPPDYGAPSESIPPPPIMPPSEANPTESTKPTEPEYEIDNLETYYCPLEDVTCIGYLNPPVFSDDVIYCSVYDKNLNVIGYYGHYYYTSYLRANIKTFDSTREQIKCEFSLKYREMVTSAGTYYYCFYNDKGKILYWGKLIVN